MHAMHIPTGETATAIREGKFGKVALVPVFQNSMFNGLKMDSVPISEHAFNQECGRHLNGMDFL